MMILSILESFYIYYMYCHFKTTKYFHHPLEIYLQRISLNDWMKHPISDESYDSKICPFGHLMGIILAIWILYVELFPYKFNLQLNILVWIMVAIVSLITNLNAFIYVIPCLIIEYIKVKFH